MTFDHTIILGADHAGFPLKEQVKQHLVKKGNPVEDMTPVFVPGDDYPMIAQLVARRVAETDGGLAILICGSGLGMDMAANRVKGARAAVARTVCDAKLARHDDLANILVLGSRVTPVTVAKRIVTAFLTTPGSRAKRHTRRVKEIDNV